MRNLKTSSHFFFDFVLFRVLNNGGIFKIIFNYIFFLNSANETQENILSICEVFSF